MSTPVRPDPALTGVRVEAARHEVYRLCAGEREWTMSIPVQRDDSDIVIANALDDTVALLAYARSLEAQLATVRREERERCASEAMRVANSKQREYGFDIGLHVAAAGAAIRALPDREEPNE